MSEVPKYQSAEDVIEQEKQRKEGEEMMSPTEKQLSEERTSLLHWLDVYSEGDEGRTDPLEYVKNVENVTENDAVAPFQNKTFLDAKGRKVRMDADDIKAARNYFIKLKDGRVNTAGVASIKLNRGLISKFSSSQWIQDAYIGDSRSSLHTHGEMALDADYKNLIYQRILEAQAIQKILENEKKAGSSQKEIWKEKKQEIIDDAKARGEL